MSSQTPTAREIAWISIVPHLAVMGVIMLIWYQFNPQRAIPNGALTYVVFSMSLRFVIPLSHRAGVKDVKGKNYQQALSKFQKSYEFFSKHKWLDKYRYLTLLSSSKISYGEMALCNIAFCHSQLGNGELTKEFYLKTLEEYPDSGMAQGAMNLINAMSKEQEEK